VLLWFVVVGAALGFALVGIPLRQHAALAVALTIVLSFGFSLLTFFLLRPKPVAAPATSSVEAVRLTGWNANTSYFHCTNYAWAQEVAYLSGGHVAPSPPRPYRAHAHVITGLIAGVAFASTIWTVAHPTVCYHNPTDKPLAFWVDGEREFVVEAGKHHVDNLPYGTREIGWSAPDAKKAEHSISADVQQGRAHLVNPEQAGCYWVTGARYGKATLDTQDLGPQPIKSFYTT
jgi:hypothetical protein